MSTPRTCGFTLYLIRCKRGSGDRGGNTQKQQPCPCFQLYIPTASLEYALAARQLQDELIQCTDPVRSGAFLVGSFFIWPVCYPDRQPAGTPSYMPCLAQESTRSSVYVVSKEELQCQQSPAKRTTVFRITRSLGHSL